ncbi:DUF6708 domain-containing protein [uncultured Pseudacidovorax sp.]|uniref:DUF6708 domain-containing protein n=1 Tax=uncultured Pseudacidovorax sp. TaxID=679313 RepID=UPI0025DCCD97|nr:DUF6708 domain-containing protein [uncultured Pseudacidovorax sp.]
MTGFNTRGVSTDDARQENLVAGLVQRYDKRLPGSPEAGHEGRLSGVYRDATELNGGSVTAAGGYVTTIGLIGCLGMNWYAWPDLIEMWGLGVEGKVATLLCLAMGISIFIVGLYFEMFSPSEQPIYFDRAHRKVYYVHQGRKRFWLFGPSVVEARSADWSLVDAELHTKLGGSTTSISRSYHMVFLVRSSERDPTIVDHFVLPALDFPGAMWEYIRGYMEAGTPPLRAGEAPPFKGQGFDMIEALKQRIRDYRRDWKEFFWKQLFFHLTLPLFLVFLLVNRCVVWTAQTVHWPPEITEALGPPITEADLAADSEHRLRAASERTAAGA